MSTSPAAPRVSFSSRDFFILVRRPILSVSLLAKTQTPHARLIRTPNRLDIDIDIVSDMQKNGPLEHNNSFGVRIYLIAVGGEEQWKHPIRWPALPAGSESELADQQPARRIFVFG